MYHQAMGNNYQIQVRLPSGYRQLPFDPTHEAFAKQLLLPDSLAVRRVLWLIAFRCRKLDDGDDRHAER